MGCLTYLLGLVVAFVAIPPLVGMLGAGEWASLLTVSLEAAAVLGWARFVQQRWGDA